MTSIFIEKKWYREPGAADESKAAPSAEPPASNPSRSRAPSNADGAAPPNGVDRRPSVNANCGAPATAPVKHTSATGKGSAPAPAPAPTPAPAQELSLLDENVLAAVVAEPVGKPEKKAQSKALPTQPEADDGWGGDPFASPAPAPAAAGLGAGPQSPAPAAAASSAPPASPIAPAVAVRAIKDCLSMIQSKGGYSIAQLRQYTLTALDELNSNSVASPAPSLGALQPGMPSPAAPIVASPAPTPAAPAPIANGSAATKPPVVNRLPSLESLVGMGAVRQFVTARPNSMID